MSEPVGTVVALHRYPVKSMMGEEITASWADERGILGDRGYALVDAETGKVASAKNPRLWGRLFEMRASFVEPPERGRPLPPVRITLPDGTVIRSDQSEADALLSDAVGRKVSLSPQAPEGAAFDEYWPDLEGLAPDGRRDTTTLESVSAAAPGGTFFDLSAFHVLTTQALDALRLASPESRFEPRRFRPNIVVRADDAEGFVENAWVERVLAIGDLKLKVLCPTMRCVMTTLAQGDLPRDPGILKTAVRVNTVQVRDLGKYPSVGVYASLSRAHSTGGSLCGGDQVFLT